MDGEGYEAVQASQQPGHYHGHDANHTMQETSHMQESQQHMQDSNHIHDSQQHMQDSNHIHDPQHHIQDTIPEHHRLNHAMQDASHAMQDASHAMQDASHAMHQTSTHGKPYVAGDMGAPSSHNNSNEGRGGEQGLDSQYDHFPDGSSDVVVKDEVAEEGEFDSVARKRSRRGRAKVKKERCKATTFTDADVDSSLSALMRKRRQDLTLGAKVKVLEMLEGEPKVPQGRIASLFRVSQSQVSRIMKNKAAIMAQWSRFATPDRKRCRLGKAGALEQRLVDWYNQAKKEDLPISGPILMEKAKSIGNEMGIDFKPSAGWLGRWKDRNGVTLKRFKEKDGTPSVMKVGNHWRRYMLPKAIKDVPLQNVWVVDETLLAFNSVPDFIPRGSVVPDGLMSVILACNIAGTERRSPLVVGRAQQLDAASLPCSYYYSPKGVVNSDSFSIWLRDWDKELRSKKKKVVLLMNMEPHHPENLHLFNITMTFFPKGTSNVLQPFRMGITHTFKSLYRHLQLKHILSKLKANELVSQSGYGQGMQQHPPSSVVSDVDGVYFVHKAWKHVSPDTIAKGVVKAGLSKDVDALNVNDHVVSPPGISQQDFDAFVQSDAELDVGDAEGHGYATGSSEGVQQQCPQYPGVYTAGNKMADNAMAAGVDNIPLAPRVSEAVMACQVLRRYFQHHGSRLFDEFTVLEAAVQTDMLTEGQPNLGSDLTLDPVHDSRSVHSLEAQQAALQQKIDYLDKIQKEINQQKVQKEGKKTSQTSVIQNSHNSVAQSPESHNAVTAQIVHKQNLHQDLTSRQDLTRIEVSPHVPMQRFDLLAPEMDYRPDTHEDAGQCTSVIELRAPNSAHNTAYRAGIPVSISHNRIDDKGGGLNVMRTELRTLADPRAELHHAIVGPGVGEVRQRLEGPELQYYELHTQTHDFMQSK